MRLGKDGICVCLERCCYLLNAGLHRFKSKASSKNECGMDLGSEALCEAVKSSVPGIYSSPT